MRDPVNVIVKHLVNAKYGNLSPLTVENVKKTILDTVGAALAGSSSEAGKTAVRVAKGYGNGKGSTIVVDGGRAAPPLAALANGVMARCRELDGTHEGGGGHVGVCIVPAALAVAEAVPSKVSGKDLILSIALGVDLLCRLRMGAGKNKAIGWMAETMAPMSVAAAGAKLQGLGEEQTLNAIGIAYALCSGNVQPTVEGMWTLWLPAGTAASSGILATDLAKEGFLGARNPLCGEFGLYRLYFRGEYDQEGLLGGLGKRNEIENTSLKPYPSCKYTHHPIYTTLKLMETHRLQSEDVEEVKILTSKMAATQCGFDEKGMPKSAPPSPSSAQFSIPFTVAAAVVKKEVTLEAFTEQAIADPLILAKAKQVQVVADPRKESAEVLYPPVDVEIRTRGGKVYSGCETYVKGHPSNPISLSECVEQFKLRASLASNRLPAGNLDAFVGKIVNLENVEDVRALMPLLL